MKVIWILLLAVMLATTGTTPIVSETARTPSMDAAGADAFDEDGYDGAWHTVAALDIEIFLPEGWTGEDADGDGVCYRALSADGGASLAICYPLEGGSTGEVVSAGGKPARLTRGGDGSLTVTMALSENRLAGFRFERESDDALSEDMALKIVGTCTDVW